MRVNLSHTLITIVISGLVGFLAGTLAFAYFINLTPIPSHFGFIQNKSNSSGNFSNNCVTQEDKVIKVVRDASPAVVSIIVTKDLPVIEKYYEEFNPFGSDEFFKRFFGEDWLSPFHLKIPKYREKGTEKKEIGGGTGFIVSSDGLILTNRHVVDDKDADYIVLTNKGEKIPAKVLARDPVQDIAILKINKKNLPVLTLGDSDKLQIGQTVIAIGNALGEFRNTVSVGVISGLKRSITASGSFGQPERLHKVIQTDAAINRGNSGGPLLNLKGEVIGINVAMAVGAENIGFALPINLAKRDIEQVKTKGKITYPFLGVRYILIDEEIKKKNNLPVDYGALVIRGESRGELAVIPGSPADKAGIQENDIILEVDGVKVNSKHPLSELIQKYNPNDTVKLKILHKGNKKVVYVKLGERE